MSSIESREPRDLAKYERLLLHERRALRATLAAVTQALGHGPEADTSRWPAADSADIATASETREEESLMADRGSAELTEVDEALRLLYAHPEEFGFCAVCGVEIDAARLDVLPATKTCATHAA